MLSYLVEFLTMILTLLAQCLFFAIAWIVQGKITLRVWSRDPMKKHRLPSGQQYEWRPYESLPASEFLQLFGKDRFPATESRGETATPPSPTETSVKRICNGGETDPG